MLVGCPNSLWLICHKLLENRTIFPYLFLDFKLRIKFCLIGKSIFVSNISLSRIPLKDNRNTAYGCNTDLPSLSWLWRPCRLYLSDVIWGTARAITLLLLSRTWCTSANSSADLNEFTRNKQQSPTKEKHVSDLNLFQTRCFEVAVFWVFGPWGCSLPDDGGSKHHWKLTLSPLLHRFSTLL
jgi:hypothetical protein